MQYPRQNTTVFAVMIAMAVLTLAGTGRAQQTQTLTVVASQDTFIWDAAADDNHGGTGSLLVGDPRDSATGTPARSRALIRFNLGAVPADAQVTSVSVRLHVFENNGGRAHTLSLHRLLRDWGEGNNNAVDQGADQGDATWNSARHELEAWGTAGAGGDSDRQATASATGTTGTAGGDVVLSGAGLIADVEAWLDGSAPNYGWLLVSDQEAANPPGLLDIDAVEAGTTTPPKLIIEYASGVAEAPTPGAAAPLPCGAMGLSLAATMLFMTGWTVRVRRRSRTVPIR